MPGAFLTSKGVPIFSSNLLPVPLLSVCAPCLAEGKNAAYLEVISTQVRLPDEAKGGGGESEGLRTERWTRCQEGEQEEGPRRTETEQSERLEENQENAVRWKTEGRSVSGWIEWSV